MTSYANILKPDPGSWAERQGMVDGTCSRCKRHDLVFMFGPDEPVCAACAGEFDWCNRMYGGCGDMKTVVNLKIIERPNGTKVSFCDACAEKDLLGNQGELF